jgi:hypothetical protein
VFKLQTANKSLVGRMGCASGTVGLNSQPKRHFSSSNLFMTIKHCRSSDDSMNWRVSLNTARKVPPNQVCCQAKSVPSMRQGKEHPSTSDLSATSHSVTARLTQPVSLPILVHRTVAHGANWQVHEAIPVASQHSNLDKRVNSLQLKSM